VNNNGQVVGVSYQGAVRHAFIWQNGVMTDLGHLGSGSYSIARAINQAGRVVGQSWDASFNLRGFLWQNGAMQALKPLPGDAISAANDINDADEVVGSSLSLSGVNTAVMWENGAIHALPSAPVPGDAEAKAINNHGQIIGTVAGTWPDLKAVLWSGDEAFVLGTIGAFTVPADINDLGQVIGYTTTADVVTHPLLWTVPIRAKLDIDPADASNTVSLGGSRSLEVAILGTPFFDVALVDAATVTLGNDDGSDAQPTSKSFKDVDADGDNDLVLEFNKDNLIGNGDLSAATTKLVLLGTRTDRRKIRGSARVTVVP
jgi:probable HAF family extracellular repeat protein